MDNDKRNFIRNSCLFAGGALIGGSLLKSCSEPFYPSYVIDVKKCTGCGDCKDVCYYSAIILPGES